ncbi:hypothetical protein LKL35_36245, partial [Streptomyces sp. ET3-23]|uniref:hypothetical protein n=1 Tax=Streptomyces sp. ET3-23 TaxID=2885643 RepID=UPI001D0FE3DA
MPTSSRLRRTVAMTAAALTTVTGGIVLGTGTAQANTHLVGARHVGERMQGASPLRGVSGEALTRPLPVR